MFQRLLIANRGEIACRVMRAAKRLGLGTIAVYSDADRGSSHVALADQAVRIGRAPATESYLSIDRVLEAARETGAQAIHPGYGFLSENADFADRCAQAGLVFIGPPAAAIRRLGNKATAKRLAAEAGVRSIDGFLGDQGDDRVLLAEARKIGFPLLIKAAAGGGGRGMRRVDSETEFLDAAAGARHEAANSFGSGELLLEQLVLDARHVEMQIIADGHGNCISLGERDCSVQRRHQKVIEEAPCPVMTPSLREAMSDAARRVALAAGYENAGTVEFLLDAKGNFYFLEVNTRLQVEHPVTEMVTGLDLVELQIRVAQGEKLAFEQEDIRLNGHAIEARLYAEDPQAGFLPQTGQVLTWCPPEGAGVRVDHGLASGDTITPYYDPMVAKVIAHGSTRAEARARLVSALADTVLFGVGTNARLLARILKNPEFAAGRHTTSFLAKTGEVFEEPPPTDLATLALAGAVLIEDASRGFSRTQKGWRSTGSATIPIKFKCRGETHAVALTQRGAEYTLAGAAESYCLRVESFISDWIRWTAGAKREQARFRIEGALVFLHWRGATHLLEDVTHAPPEGAGGFGGGAIKSPMSGAITRVAVAPGDRVAKGDLLLVVEAMKMENHVSAPRDGVVEAVHVAAGTQVDSNQLLMTLAEWTESQVAAPKEAGS